MVRHLVKPGITGLAQINGLRGETNHPDKMQRRVQMDVYYLENWNFALDLKIIVHTVVNMVKGQESAF
jgi:lipopolysaccharide/colanic/teichoic acid biosynthesis glycosyltransferase